MTDDSRIKSNVTVDPGSIAAFATFLDEMLDEIRDIEDRLEPFATGVKKVDFGEFQTSSGAQSRHLTLAEKAHENVRTLAGRTEELVHGTDELARQYANLSALNGTRANEITTALNQPVKEA
ncbi:hypothetical protein [Enemella sp. A6]|uniref:hypothetical protein n=1 Tax=Enemella sp. A6 TaxID=3440152 RepID=UPI003EBD03CD